MIKDNETIKEHVKKTYSELATQVQLGADCGCSSCGSTDCCGPNVDGLYAQGIGYSQKDIKDLPETVLGAAAGCGNPTALAKLREGETVLDLGSGGGIDVFLAAKQVGPTGRVIGVDMTHEMIELARKNAEKIGLFNVEFRKGDIENLPIDDETVDVIISNCVINLAPDKDKVFSEAYRVLKPGGRVTVSDIITDGELPDEIKESAEHWSACIAGALEGQVYLEKIRNAGFKDVTILSSRGFGIIKSAEIEGYKPFN